MYINAEIWMVYMEFIFSYTVFRAKCTLQRDYMNYCIMFYISLKFPIPFSRYIFPHSLDMAKLDIALHALG